MARPKISLIDRSLIIRESIAILEAQGLAGFNLRRLGARLSVNSASIYHYFDSKEDILRAAAGTLLREMQVPPYSEDWKRFFIETALSHWRFLVAKPFLASLMIAGLRPTTEVDEYLSMMLSRAEVPREFHPDIFVAIEACIVGSALFEATRAKLGANAARPNPEMTLKAALVAILEHMLAEICASKTTKRKNAPVQDSTGSKSSIASTRDVPR
jgi:AcrR family transcriptional regulator